MIKLAVVIACGLLFAWGGNSWTPARRYGMPLLLSCSLALLIKTLTPLWMLIAVPLLCFGYGDNAPLRHAFGSCWGRGIWGLLVGLALSTPLLIYVYIGYQLYALYLVISFFSEPLLKNLNQMIGDFAIGMGFGTIILFCSHP